MFAVVFKKIILRISTIIPQAHLVFDIQFVKIMRTFMNFIYSVLLPLVYQFVGINKDAHTNKRSKTDQGASKLGYIPSRLAPSCSAVVFGSSKSFESYLIYTAPIFLKRLQPHASGWVPTLYALYRSLAQFNI